ncbi:MAG TPA: hypothetical protein VF550_15185 [Polyangia bacterium]
MKSMTCAALLLTARSLLPSSPALAQVSDWPYATRQPLPAKPAPRFTEPEGPVTSWDPQRFQVGLETRTTWLLDDAAKRLAGKRSTTGGGLSLQADVLRPIDKLAARVDLSWVTTSSTTLQENTSLSERLDTHVISLGLSARYSLLRWLSPYARLAGGVGWDKLTVGSGVNSMHDRQVFGQGSAGAGVSLRSPGLRFWRSPSAPFVGVMGQIEGGYALASGSDFSLQSSPAGSAANAIPTSPIAIGHVGRSAPYLRASLGIAF